MAIPPSCTKCGMFQQPGDLCRRHAPSPTTARREVALWPRREPDSRCGEGSYDPPVRCSSCLFWWQPAGKPLVTEKVQPAGTRSPIWFIAPKGHDEYWWAQSGFCVRYTASPAGETQLYHPRVTHATLD